MSRLRNNRNGAVIVLLAFLLPLLLIFIGFSVDLANMQRARAELRIATDMAARAAAEKLAQTGDILQARAGGKVVASGNQVCGKGLTLDDSDFEFGNASQLPSGKWSFVVQASDLNSVRVTGARNAASLDGPIQLYFGNFIGRSVFEPSVTAVAAFQITDICLVLDRSSSMKRALTEIGGMPSGDSRWCQPPNGSARWKDLDTAVHDFLDELTATGGQENVAMVTFGGAMNPGTEDCGGLSDHSIVSLDQDLTIDLTLIEDAMDARMNSIWNGNTDIAAGLTEGINVLQNARPNAEKIIILLTDGEYTEANPVPVATIALNNDIKVHTVTFGPNPAGSWITDMQTIASTTGGIHLHAPTKQALIATFKELASLVSIIVE